MNRLTASNVLKFMQDKNFDGKWWHLNGCVCTQNSRDGKIMDPDCQRSIMRSLEQM